MERASRFGTAGVFGCRSVAWRCGIGGRER
jgi:hypothetical protein